MTASQRSPEMLDATLGLETRSRGRPITALPPVLIAPIASRIVSATARRQPFTAGQSATGRIERLAWYEPRSTRAITTSGSTGQDSVSPACAFHHKKYGKLPMTMTASAVANGQVIQVKTSER